VIHFVTCGLTACTPGSAPGPTLGNEYGKTLLNYLTCRPKLGMASEINHETVSSRRHRRSHSAVGIALCAGRAAPPPRPPPPPTICRRAAEVIVCDYFFSAAQMVS